MKMRLHRSLGDAENLSDLWNGQIRLVAQHETLTLPARQPSELCAESGVAQRLRMSQRLRVTVRAIREKPQLCRTDRQPPNLRAAEIQHDSVEILFGLRRIIKLIDRLSKSDVRLLNEFFGLVHVPDDPEGRPYERLVVEAVEFLDLAEWRHLDVDSGRYRDTVGSKRFAALDHGHARTTNQRGRIVYPNPELSADSRREILRYRRVSAACHPNRRLVRRTW